MAPDQIWSFEHRRIGRRVCFYHELSSTNDLAAQSDEPEGTVIVADYQSKGRGQHGRTWHSRSGVSLLCSVLLKPPLPLQRPVILTALAAVAIGDAILELTGVQARIKWPNDLLIRGKKICGILIEQARGTVIGIGLNINQSTEEFRSAGLIEATSLQILRNEHFELKFVLETILGALDDEYDRLLAAELIPLESDWKWRIGLLGRTVDVELLDGQSVRGRLLEMSFDRIELALDTGPILPIQPETIRHIRQVSG